MRNQEPAAAPLIEMMQSIACNMPGNFAEPEAHVPLHQLAKRIVVLYLVHEGFAPDANCGSRNTHDHIHKCPVHAEQSDELAVPSTPMAAISTIRPSSMVLVAQTSPRLMKWMYLIVCPAITICCPLTRLTGSEIRSIRSNVIAAAEQQPIVDAPGLVKRCDAGHRHGGNAFSQVTTVSRSACQKRAPKRKARRARRVFDQDQKRSTAFTCDCVKTEQNAIRRPARNG